MRELVFIGSPIAEEFSSRFLIAWKHDAWVCMQFRFSYGIIE